MSQQQLCQCLFFMPFLRSNNFVMQILELHLHALPLLLIFLLLFATSESCCESLESVFHIFELPRSYFAENLTFFQHANNAFSSVIVFLSFLVSLSVFLQSIANQYALLKSLVPRRSLQNAKYSFTSAHFLALKVISIQKSLINDLEPMGLKRSKFFYIFNFLLSFKLSLLLHLFDYKVLKSLKLFRLTKNSCFLFVANILFQLTLVFFLSKIYPIRHKFDFLFDLFSAKAKLTQSYGLMLI